MLEAAYERRQHVVDGVVGQVPKQLFGREARLNPRSMASLPCPHEDFSRLRTRNVRNGFYRAASAENTSALDSRFGEWINEHQGDDRPADH